MSPVTELQTQGHDVLDIRGTQHQGMFDEELWPFTQEARRMLVTTDKGFMAYRDEQHFGILVVRLRQPNEKRIHTRVMAAFDQFSDHEWPGLLLVMRGTAQSVYRARLDGP